jgi:hypothetical protein
MLPILEGMVMEMVMLLLMMINTLLPCQGSVVGDDGVDFPLASTSEQKDVPSPREEEDFRLHHRLKKYVKNWGRFFCRDRDFVKRMRRTRAKLGSTTRPRS